MKNLEECFYVIETGYDGNPLWAYSIRRVEPKEDCNPTGVEFLTNTGWCPIESSPGQIVFAHNKKEAIEIYISSWPHIRFQYRVRQVRYALNKCQSLKKIEEVGRLLGV